MKALVVKTNGLECIDFETLIVNTFKPLNNADGQGGCDPSESIRR